MKRLLVLVLSSITLLGGCGFLQGQPEELKLAVDSRAYAPGEAVVLKLENNTERAISHNLCYATLERRAGGDWNDAQHRFGEVCEDKMHVLEPGESATFTSQLAADLQTGVYRLVARVYTDDQMAKEVATGSFTLGD